MRVTMKEVARHAGVSVTTVSLVLSDAPGIAAATRKKVQEVVQQLKYTPNDQARRLFSGRAGTVALVMPPWTAAFADPYFLELMRGTLESVRDRGYELLLEISDSRFLNNRLWERLYASKRVDGFLIATPYLDQDYLRELAERSVPTMLINGDRPDLPSFDFVGYDDLQCGIQATQHLLELGHTRIAHVAGSANHASAERRLEGYATTMRAAGLTIPPTFVVRGEYMPLEARSAVEALVELPPGQRPTAFFCANDTMALSVMTFLQERGLRVPEDISVVGVDDTGAASRATPGLSTFRQDIFALARTAAELFLKRLETGQPPAAVRTRLPMPWVPRGSTAVFDRLS